VLLLPPDAGASLPEDQQWEYAHANVNERLDRWGLAFSCNDAGIVTVPVPDVGSFPVGARAGGRWGRQDLRNAQRDLPAEIRIEIRRALHLRVLVVDESRIPVVGVPVVYRKLHGGSGDDFAEADTDEQGIAQLSHLQDLAMRPMNPECDEHVVALGVAAQTTVQASFDPLAPPDDPIVLVLPATGSVEIAVFDAAGQPVEDGLPVVLQTPIKFNRPNPVPEPRLWVQGSRNSRVAPVKEGIARFDHVGLGLELEYGADFSRTGYIERRLGLGPQRAGEVARLHLRQKEEDPALSGRVVDENAVTIPNLELEAAIIFSGERALHQARFLLSTDAEGRFRASVPSAHLKTGLTYLQLKDAAAGRIRIAVAGFDAPLAPGDTDLGVLVLGGPLLISGMAVDERMRPRGDAEGRITLERIADPNAPRSRGPFHFLAWQAGEDGRFEVRGAYPAGRYRIQGSIAGAFYLHCGPMDFDSGASDLVLEFRHSRGIYGRVRVDETVPVDALHVALAGGEEDVVGGVSPAGILELHPRKSGSYTLVIRTHENGEAVWTMPDLLVDSTQYRDLGEIDLRGKLVTTRVALSGTVGNSQKAGGFYSIHESGNWVHVSAPFPHTFLTLDRERVAWISVGGSMLTEVRLDGLDKTVQMPVAVQVAVYVDGLPPCPDGSDWRLTFRAGSADGLPFVPEFSARINPQSRADLSIWIQRTGLLMAELSSKDPVTGRYLRVSGAFGDPPFTIEISESESLQEFRLLADAAAISRAMNGE